MNRQQRRIGRKPGGATPRGPLPAIQGFFEAALQQHRDGHLAEAEQLYQKVLAADPRHGDSLHLLGVAAGQKGQHGLSAELIGRAIRINAGREAYHSSLGLALGRLGRLPEAAACYRRALALRPDSPEAHYNLGVALMKQGQPEAAACYRRALELQPERAEAHYNLGLVLAGEERPAEAEACYRRALALQPDHPEAHNNLGIALRKQSRLEEAIACYQQALALRPDYPEAHNNLGNAFREQGRLEEAAACYRRALDGKPNYAEAHYNLGVARGEQGQLAAAVACYQRALALRPDYPEAHNNLGNALGDQGRLEEAIACYRRALDGKPDYAEAHNNLGVALGDQGRLEAAAACYDRAIDCKPEFFPAYSNRLFTQNHFADQPPEIMRGMAQRFGALLSCRARPAFSSWRGVPAGQPLRVGLVSGDLRNHPVGYFLEGPLRAVDPRRIEFLAFPSSAEEDELTARIKPAFRAWKPIHALSDAAAARVIHEQGVQVLLDLSGHTQHNRLPVFAWRPAPVQAAWLGYFATTGVAEMDYIIGDPNVTPPAEAHHFTEAIWPLPEIYYCFAPPEAAVTVSPLPAPSQGGVTFGCFNNLAKLSDEVVAVWARVLRAVDSSRLMLKARQLADPAVRSSIRARFAAQGIAESRLLLEPPSLRADYLSAYHRVDIALDPFPYPGGATSAEALWMGVPVLTKRGNRFLSHAGETIARNAGLADWVAADADDYVARAARFAADLEGLAALRARLRSQVLASPLFDAARFARHFEAALWGMWHRRQADAAAAVPAPEAARGLPALLA